MNRYQFEDLISEYIENELSLSKRKQFEIYLDENPDAGDLVESVRMNMTTMKHIPKIKASPDFNERLLAKIKAKPASLQRESSSQRTYFGFSPIHASMMSGLLIAFVFVSMQLFSSEENTATSHLQYLANDPVPSLSNPSLQNAKQASADFADVQEDSSSDDTQNKPQKDFSKQMHFVND